MKKVFLVLVVITLIFTGCQKNEFLPDNKLLYKGDLENGKREGKEK